MSDENTSDSPKLPPDLARLSKQVTEEGARIGKHRSKELKNRKNMFLKNPNSPQTSDNQKTDDLEQKIQNSERILNQQSGSNPSDTK